MMKNKAFYAAALAAALSAAGTGTVTAAEPEKPASPATPSTTTAPAPATPPAPGVVATVNGENITREQLVNVLIKQYGSSILERLVDQKILEQAAAKQGVAITPADLDLEYQAYKTTLPPAQMGAFAEYEKRVGRDFILESLKPQLIIKRIGSKLVNLDSADLDEVRASHILIVPDRTATDEAGKMKADAEARKKAEEVLALAKKQGADFAALAKEHSKDTGSAQRGGDLDFFGKGRMVPAFEEAAFKARKGEIVGPVKSDFGYHIIKVVDRKDAASMPKAELEAKRTQHIRRMAQEPVNQWMDRQRKEAKVQKFILDTGTGGTRASAQ